MAKIRCIRWFDTIRLKDLPEVGGKNASLGELHALLAADGGRVPDGSHSPPVPPVTRLMPLEPGRSCVASFPDFHHDVALLVERAAAARHLVYEATGNAVLRIARASST